MFISKKRFNEAIKEAQEKAFMEADKARWHNEEMGDLRRMVRELDDRIAKIENKGKKRFLCPCAVFPRNF